MSFGFQSGVGVGGFIPPSLNFGLYSQTNDSALITATTIEKSLIGSGLGTLSVLPNTFNVGDAFRVDMSGIWSTKVNDKLTISVKSGAIVLASSGLQNLPNSTNNVWQLSMFFTIRKIGGIGVAEIVTCGMFHDVKTSNGNQEGFAFNVVNNTTFDTTILNTLDITAQFSSNSAINKMYSNIFVLSKIY